jgi:hypothetical protein
MTPPSVDTLERPTRPKPGRSASFSAQRSRGRMLTGLVILVSFTATTLLQHLTQGHHQELVKNTGSEAKISNLNSFSLALLLGGLRGPLVMMLWTSSETQKQEKDLEDFDSKIELIRLLQPEFDSVHLFQMWNKAYNISVQMANKPNKYATIVDAIDYGYKIDEQKPNDINILSQIGQIFFDKLGNSQEKDYYIDRVRRESFPDENVTIPTFRVKELDALLAKAGVESAKRDGMIGQASRSGSFTVGKLTADALRPLLNGPGVSYTVSTPVVLSDTNRRIRLSPMLDLDGRILPALANGTPRPADLPAEAEWNNGSELQYLKKYEPFPYGIPPMAIGWNYYKRCQVLRDVTHQKHLQLSDLVIDNRPAINLKLWGEAEWAMGRVAEMRAFAMKQSKAENTADQRAFNELPTAAMSPTAPIADLPAAIEAAYHYNLVADLAVDSAKEYERHLKHHANSNFHSHLDSMNAMRALCLADRDYLRAMVLPVGDAGRAPLLKAAAEEYNKAMLLWERMILKYYIGDQIAAGIPQLNFPGYPRGFTKDNIDSMPDALVHALSIRVDALLAAYRDLDVEQDRREAQQYVRRAAKRLLQLNAAPDAR